MPLFNSSLWNGTGVVTVPNSTLVSDLLYAALRMAGVTTGPGRVPSPPQYSDALSTFNRMVGFLNTNRMNIWTMTINLWPTAAQVQSYTIGPGATWDGARPQDIWKANLLLPTSPVVRKPLQIITDEGWADIRLQQVYTYPNKLYNDGANPLSTIYFWPIPNDVYSIELYTWQMLDGATDLTTLLAYPPGYEEAIVSNLAIRLIPVFQLPPRADVNEIARKSLAAIQSLNTFSPKLKNDMATGRGGYYNYMTGQIEP